MKTQLNIDKLIKVGKIQNELELERAFIAERKLKLLAKENPELNIKRKALRDLIEAYENENWSSNSEVSEERIKESDSAELIAEQERLFIAQRKRLIKDKLKSLGLNQQELGMILGHNNKSYISELINGVAPFAIRDLVVINKLLKIELTKLVPTFLPNTEWEKVRSSIEKLDNPKLESFIDDLVLA